MLINDKSTVNVAKKTISYQGKQFYLQDKEMQLLLLLLERRGEIVKKEMLISRLWPNAKFDRTDNLIQLVYRVRQVLRKVELHNYLLTERNAGYIFVNETAIDMANNIHPSLADACKNLLNQQITLTAGNINRPVRFLTILMMIAMQMIIITALFYFIACFG